MQYGVDLVTGMIRTPEEQREFDQQARNDPIVDGYVRSRLVLNQPSEIAVMTDSERWAAESENSGDKETR